MLLTFVAAKEQVQCHSDTYEGVEVPATPASDELAGVVVSIQELGVNEIEHSTYGA